MSKVFPITRLSTENFMKKQFPITKKFIDSFRSIIGTNLRNLLPTSYLCLYARANSKRICSRDAICPRISGCGRLWRNHARRQGRKSDHRDKSERLRTRQPTRQHCEAEGPRIVVFKVSGTITLESTLEISNSYITIAGQTAPGDGICLKRYPISIKASEVIIRYIRVRLGDETGDDTDAISGKHKYPKNIILDHMSASWSVDETVSIYYCENVTIQWCLISESMYYAGHVKGAHGYGGIWGSNRSTYHHNLLAHHSSRNPRFASGCGYNDFRNNVVYNWGYNSAYGGEKQRQGYEKFNFLLSTWWQTILSRDPQPVRAM